MGKREAIDMQPGTPLARGEGKRWARVGDASGKLAVWSVLAPALTRFPSPGPMACMPCIGARCRQSRPTKKAPKPGLSPAPLVCGLVESLERLTRDRHGKGPHGEKRNSTTNACKRTMGWWINEPSRRMRGSQVPEHAVRVSRFLAWWGTFLTQGGANLASLIQSLLLRRNETRFSRV